MSFLSGSVRCIALIRFSNLSIHLRHLGPILVGSVCVSNTGKADSDSPSPSAIIMSRRRWSPNAVEIRLYSPYSGQEQAPLCSCSTVVLTVQAHCVWLQCIVLVYQWIVIVTLRIGQHSTVLIIPYYRPYWFGFVMGECFCVGYEHQSTIGLYRDVWIDSIA